MANSDYSERGSGLICPNAISLGTFNPGQTEIVFGSYKSSGGVVPAVGSALMIEQEIMRLVSINFTTNMMVVARGCADTVPVTHSANKTIWFFESALGTDQREYMATETIGVKLLMRTGGAIMEAKNSPPNTLVFNQRFARPYPPGNFKINDSAFYLGPLIFGPLSIMNLSWAHRDRITQDDQLIGHEVASIGPEAGVTYIIKLYRANDTLVRSVAVDGTSWSYTLGDATNDYDATTAATVAGYLTLCAVRGGLESFQRHRVDFTIALAGVTGWGMDWGNNWNN